MDSKAATSGSRVAEIFECAGSAFNKLASLTMSLHEDQLLVEANVSGGNCKWSTAEISKLKNAINRFGSDLSRIAESIQSKSLNQIKQKMRSKAFQEANLGEPPTVASSATESLNEGSQKDNEESIKKKCLPPSEPGNEKEEYKPALSSSIFKTFTPGKSLIGGNIIVSRRKTLPVNTPQTDSGEKKEEAGPATVTNIAGRSRSVSPVKKESVGFGKDRRKQILKRMPEEASGIEYSDSEEDYEPPRSFQDAPPPKKMARIQQVNFQDEDEEEEEEEEEEVYYDEEDEEEYGEDNGYYGENWQEGEYPSEEDQGDYDLPDEGDEDEEEEYFDEETN